MTNIEKINEALLNPTKGRNSMGVSEAYYNPYYLLGKYLEQCEGNFHTEEELSMLLKFADFTTEIFY